MSASEAIPTGEQYSGKYLNFRPAYLKIKSKDSYPHGERPYFSPEAERLLVTAAENSSLVGLSGGKLPSIPAMSALEPKFLEELRSLVQEGLILLIPRIFFNKTNGNLELAFNVLASFSSKKTNPENIKSVFFEIMRKSAWAVRTYEIISQRGADISLPFLLTSLAEGTSPGVDSEDRDIPKDLLRKIYYKNIIHPDVIKDSLALIHSFIEEEGILTPTIGCGYVHIPDQEVDVLFDLVSDLYAKKVIPKLVENSPKLAENLISLRENVLNEESNLLSSDPIFVRKSIFSEEFAKLGHLMKSDSAYCDFFRLAKVVSQKSLESDTFTREAREKAVENGLRKAVLNGKGALGKFLSLGIGRDVAWDSKIAKSVQEDPALLSYAFYSEGTPELFVCPSEDAAIREILRALNEKYSFRNSAVLNLLLLLFKHKQKLMGLLSDSSTKDHFCELGYHCLSDSFSWFRRLLFSLGLRGSLLNSVLAELGTIQYHQLNEKMRFEEKLSQIKNQLRQELITEVRDLLETILHGDENDSGDRRNR